MKKVIVFQHVAHKILGTLNPTLKKRGLNIRYVNFERTPDESPSLDKYNGLIILGGHMGVYEGETYKHIRVELKLIEEALKKQIPVLGICLGAQMLAHVLGSHVRRHSEMEVGWCDITLTDEGLQSKLFSHFNPTEKIFQLHGDTFDVPNGAKHLAYSPLCKGQAFSYGENAFGLQFHLEVDTPMIKRWLGNPKNQQEIFSLLPNFSEENMLNETSQYIERSLFLSQHTFNAFIDQFGLKEKPIRLGSR
jgi:GMP synthase (glutamine-hydrolysing)